MNNLWLNVATLGPIGMLPAPGTIASCCMIPFIILLRTICPCSLYILYTGIGIIFGFICIKRSLGFFSESDPSSIVIDECVGCLIAFTFMPMTFFNVVIGLIMFRFFDITKCLGIRWCERISGPWGILTDDMLAGIMTIVLMQIIYLIQHFYV